MEFEVTQICLQALVIHIWLQNKLHLALEARVVFALTGRSKWISLLFFKNNVLKSEWWHMFVIPTTRKAESGMKTSLSCVARCYHKRKRETLKKHNFEFLHTIVVAHNIVKSTESCQSPRESWKYDLCFLVNHRVKIYLYRRTE